ncbi:MAG: tRNA (adenosine(37)-N6)-threonylcarbamoyltransferase complex ATPase subunit type 1 TsaE [Pseudomonadota bacterium]|nr:tRNA (adenosine(37)-N6)-threonylcarbamoyltransferase complex ATPase subunit type 1 TsaE [Pseudomonadota bacterium]
MNAAKRRAFLRDEQATLAWGEAFSQVIESPLVVELRGELGAGKTTFVRGLLRGLRYDGAVRSPTYTLIEPYELDDATVYHLDLYRLGEARELEYLGLDDLEPRSIWLVEWPERGRGWLPPSDVVIEIEYVDPGRSVCMKAITPGGRRVLQRFEALVGSGSFLSDNKD